MIWLRNALVCLLLASLILVAIQTAALLHTVRGTVALLPVMTHAAIREQGTLTRAAVIVAIANVRRETLAEVTRTRTDLLARVDRLTDVSEQSITDLTARVDNQMTVLNTTVASALVRANTSVAQVAGTVVAVRPVLENSAVLLDDARRSWDDLYPDVKASVESGTVAARSIAEASTAVSHAAPATAASVESITGSAASIARSWEKHTPLYVRFLGWVGRGFISVKALMK